MGPEWRKRVGELLILLIYLLLEAFGIWPLSHFWALVTGVAGIVALLLFDGALTIARISGASGVLVVIAAMIYWFAGPNLPEETPEHGWLLPANDPTPPNGCTSGKVGPPGFQMPVSADDLLFVVGGNGILVEGPRKTEVLR